jgi:hypothetical protein
MELVAGSMEREVARERGLGAGARVGGGVDRAAQVSLARGARLVGLL